MRSAIHYIPIVTTVFAALFSAILFRRYRSRPGSLHHLWWGIGIAVYGLGTLFEALITLVGWKPWLFRGWYISGALLGGAPLAQGTVYLLMKRRVAHVLSAILILYVVIAATFVLLTPINYDLVEPHRPSGKVIVWSWVRLFSPFVNTYAVIFLIGGAILSAIRYRRRVETRHRFIGNVLIAVGAILPGIGGAATRMGYVEVLYVTELIGLILIWFGYRFNVSKQAWAAGAQVT